MLNSEQNYHNYEEEEDFKYDFDSEQRNKRYRLEEDFNMNANNDDEQLKRFLKAINMECIFEALKAANVTFRCLPYLKENDLKEPLPHLGFRVEFREKLLAWQKSQAVENDHETESIRSRVSASNLVLGASLKMDLKTLLNDSAKGRALLEYANQNKKFSCVERDEIINIIVDDVISKNMTLNPSDFILITGEICSVFPFEDTMKDYYYIPRKGKNNPSGKLYSKYKNKCSKKRKQMSSVQMKSPTTSQDSDNDAVEFDESVSMELKNSLNEDNGNWKDICDKWMKTFNLRQKELQSLTSQEFLQAWSKLSDTRAPVLINIDFDIMYPNKGQSLFSKWKLFKYKIRQYYDNHIHNEFCKQLLSKITLTTSTDSQDFIYTVLLNAVLPSPARFKNQLGKRVKKVTIADSVESLVLRLTSINDYEQQINELTNKYYAAELTVQPFIIVEGLTDDNIVGFYVYFNNNLLQFDSFIECLDTCFKIFLSLSLKYPDACEQPWLFIQKFFYDITTKYDSKSAKVTSLIDFLNNSD